jgi:hypothetical protein
MFRYSDDGGEICPSYQEDYHPFFSAEYDEQDIIPFVDYCLKEPKLRYYLEDFFKVDEEDDVNKRKFLHYWKVFDQCLPKFLATFDFEICSFLATTLRGSISRFIFMLPYFMGVRKARLEQFSQLPSTAWDVSRSLHQSSCHDFETTFWNAIKYFNVEHELQLSFDEDQVKGQWGKLQMEEFVKKCARKKLIDLKLKTETLVKLNNQYSRSQSIQSSE